MTITTVTCSNCSSNLFITVMEKIDISRVVQPSREKWMEFMYMTICVDTRVKKHILENPVGLPCGHVSCKSCVNYVLGCLSEECHGRSLSETDLTPVMISVSALLNGLSIQCDFEGCQEVLPLTKIKEHERTCLHNHQREEDCPKCGFPFPVLAGGLMAHDCLAKVLEWNHELQSQLKVKDEFLKNERQIKDVLEECAKLRVEVEEYREEMDRMQLLMNEMTKQRRSPS